MTQTNDDLPKGRIEIGSIIETIMKTKGSVYRVITGKNLGGEGFITCINDKSLGEHMAKGSDTLTEATEAHCHGVTVVMKNVYDRQREMEAEDN